MGDQGHQAQLIGLGRGCHGSARFSHVKMGGSGGRMDRFNRWIVGAVFAVFAGVAPVHAQLWPGQSPAQGYVQFPNGAYGAVTASTSTSHIVQWFDGQNIRSTEFARAQMAPANDNIAPQKWASWVIGRTLAGVGSVLAAALMPDMIADGTVNSFCAATQSGSMVGVCQASGHVSCQSSQCGGGWESAVSLPCVRLYEPDPDAPDDGSGYVTIGTVRNPASSNRQVLVPSCEGTVATFQNGHTFYEFNGALVSVPSHVPVTPPTPLPSALSVAQIAATAGVISYGNDLLDPWLPGGQVAPDIWNAVSFPAELAAPLPASVMKPLGYPASGVGVTVHPQAVPAVTPWASPVPDAWPVDHPAVPAAYPSPGSVPSVNPDPNPDPNPNPDPGGSNPPVAGLTDVRVTNFGTPGWIDAPELVEQERTLPNLSGGTRWLTPECPPPIQLDVMGFGAFPVSFELICDPLSIFGWLLLASAFMQAGFVVFGTRAV